MAITYLPQAGSITEKNIADYWNGALAGQAYLTGYYSNARRIDYSGLNVFLVDTLGVTSGFGTTVVLNGYATKVSSNSDLSVTLPANSLSYVYFVMDMAGGGTNTISQRLVYYSSPVYLSNGVLMARVVTDATTVTELTTLTPTRQQNIMAYPANVLPGSTSNLSLYAYTERTTTDTTGVLVKQFCVEYAGVYDFSCELKCSGGFTVITAYVYAASTGDTHGTSTPQLALTHNTSTYTTKTGTLALSEGDVVSVYLKSANATYTGYIDTVSITGYACVPLAPAFQIE